METPIQETTDLFRFQITEEQEEERVDKCIAALIDSLSRSFIQKMIKEGRVCINGLPVKASCQVKAGDDLSFLLPKAQEPDIEPEDIPLDILYEDSDVLVVNKPKDMVVHPAAGHYSHTLVNAVLYHCKGQLSGINGVLRPGIVHRIDKDTTGSVIVCKNDAAHQALAVQFADHTITRRYRAIVHGVLTDDEGIIDAPIGRDNADRKKWRLTMCMANAPSPIIPSWSVLNALPISNAAWRPGAPIRSVSTWRQSGIRFWETVFMVRKNARFQSSKGRHCTR